MEQGGYRDLMEKSFKPFCKAGITIRASAILAVLYDKNIMENSGYAAVMADVFKRPVYLVPFHDEEEHPHVRHQK